MNWICEFETHFGTIGIGAVVMEGRCEDESCGRVHGYVLMITLLCWSVRIGFVRE